MRDRVRFCVFETLGYLLRELAFKTDCRGTPALCDLPRQDAGAE